MASTSRNGIRRDRSISSADAWLCGASPLAASMKADEASSDMEPPCHPAWGRCYRDGRGCVAVVARVKMLGPATDGIARADFVISIANHKLGVLCAVLT